MTTREKIKQRVDHNARYLAQSDATRAAAGALSVGRPVTPEWLEGERAAIEAENEFLREVLKT